MSTTLSPITSVNPATEEVLAQFDPFTPEEVALLNEVDLNQEISSGKILKIPSPQQ